MEFRCRPLALVFMCIIQLAYSDGATCRSPEYCLYQDLFTEYNTYIRPRARPSEKVEVTAGLILSSLANIDERNEVMNIVAVIFASWTDPFLQWDPEQYNGTELLNLPVDQVWHPEIAILNSADNFFQRSHTENFFALIRSNGLVTWFFGGTFSTTCSLDISRFPFDSQSCSLEVYNWGYNIDYVTLTSSGETDTSAFTNNSLWDLMGTSTDIIQSTADNTYVGIMFTLHWKRKAQYYLFNMVLPIVLLLLVSIGVFWLPPESGERVSLAITVLLSYAVFLIVIMDTMPVNSETVPLLSQFVMVVMIFTTIALLQSLLAVRLSMKDSPPPSWLRKLTFDYLAPLFCSRRNIPVVGDHRVKHIDENKVEPQQQVEGLENVDDKPKVQNLQHNTELELLTVMGGLLKLQRDQMLTDSYCSEWKLIGKLLDKLVLVTSLTGVVIAFIVIFVA